MRVLLGSLAVCAFAALIAAALPRGLADLRAFEARRFIPAWENRNLAAPSGEWERARDGLLRARELDPRHPGYLEDLARLYEYRGLRSAPGAAQEDFARALEYLRAEAVRRPSSSYTWAGIALLKARMGVPDAEYEAALRSAAALGPWEPAVQLAIADAGLRYWNRLAPETRTALGANLARSLRWQDKAVFDLARRLGRLDVVCATPGVTRSPFARSCI